MRPQAPLEVVLVIWRWRGNLSWSRAPRDRNLFCCELHLGPSGPLSEGPGDMGRGFRGRDTPGLQPFLCVFQRRLQKGSERWHLASKGVCVGCGAGLTQTLQLRAVFLPGKPAQPSRACGPQPLPAQPVFPTACCLATVWVLQWVLPRRGRPSAAAKSSDVPVRCSVCCLGSGVIFPQKQSASGGWLPAWPKEPDSATATAPEPFTLSAIVCAGRRRRSHILGSSARGSGGHGNWARPRAGLTQATATLGKSACLCTCVRACARVCVRVFRRF